MNRKESKILVYSFSALVNIFLGLIMTKLLDTFLANLHDHKLSPGQYCAFITVALIVVHSFIVFFKLSADGGYAFVLAGSPFKYVMRLLVATLAIMVWLYSMAFWFSLTTLYYIAASVALAFFWMMFDWMSVQMIKAYIKAPRVERVGVDGAMRANGVAALLRLARLWLCCDAMLTVLMTLTWWAFKKNKFGGDMEAALVASTLFIVTAFLVGHIVRVELPEGRIVCAEVNNEKLSPRVEDASCVPYP